MPPTKKRKITDVSSGQSSTSVQQGIQKFAKVSKAHVDREIGGKRKGDELVRKAGNINANEDGCLKKRKLGGRKEVLSKQDHNDGHLTSAQSHPDRHTPESFLPRTSASSNRSSPLKRKARSEPSSTETPSKGARSCLELLALGSSSPSDLNSSPLSKRTQTPPSSPLSSPSRAKDLIGGTSAELPVEIPVELQELIDLHASFLTALSLHYAHNGSFTPADLRGLIPIIERSWRKQRVSMEDVRRIIAVSQEPDVSFGSDKLSERGSTLSLSDYGSGKICVEIEARSEHHGLQRRPIDEEAVNERFKNNLLRKWRSFSLNNPPIDSPSKFVSHLPLASIEICASLSKLSPLRAKGQRRLEDLKAGAIRAQLSSSIKTTISPASIKPQTSTIARRSDSLLSRIRAKQLHQSTLAPPPPPATILRKSALQRLEEVAPVLEILTTASTRSAVAESPELHLSTPPHGDDDGGGVPAQGTCSFTMPTLVQHLQMSLRNPIAKEDAVRCVRLLAAEVAPRWVTVREVGRVVGVTIRRAEGVGREEIGRRVGELLKSL